MLFFLLKSARGTKRPLGCPQMGWLWTATFDFGPFKSEFNGKHDLPGGKYCPLCSTKYRYGHLLVHSEWNNPL